MQPAASTATMQTLYFSRFYVTETIFAILALMVMWGGVAIFFFAGGILFTPNTCLAGHAIGLNRRRPVQNRPA